MKNKIWPGIFMFEIFLSLNVSIFATESGWEFAPPAPFQSGDISISRTLINSENISGTIERIRFTMVKTDLRRKDEGLEFHLKIVMGRCCYSGLLHPEITCPHADISKSQKLLAEFKSFHLKNLLLDENGRIEFDYISGNPETDIAPVFEFFITAKQTSESYFKALALLLADNRDLISPSLKPEVLDDLVSLLKFFSQEFSAAVANSRKRGRK